ncbi:MAG: hypothetical protein Q4E88_02765 [Coriobacteriia bacterium]|nr:hypothetical protein [Coriobacteriia bacterium]
MPELATHAKTVKLRHKTIEGQDDYNNDTFSWTEENVYPALVAPTESQEDASSVDINGFTVKYDLILPKTYTRDLTGSEAYLDGVWMQIRFPSGNFDTSPNSYGRTVKVGIKNG